MYKNIGGIHHITAIASDPQRNIDFYAGFLGLRLVKKTVNFDAPDVYHLYYGDETGRPGTVLTFFPFPNAVRGKRGTGEITAVGFSVAPDSLDYWVERLARHGLNFDGPYKRFDNDVIMFEDPDGMAIELVTDGSGKPAAQWQGSAVEANHATRGFHGVTLTEASLERTAGLLVGLMGFTFEQKEGNRHRYAIGEGEGRVGIDIIVDSTGVEGSQSAGSVHHIAWRVADDAAQLEWRQRLLETGIQATTVQDRNYFNSIYYREPGGVLFEIATDTPGFMIDESREELGSSLKLPPWFESRRKRIEELLIPISVPKKRMATA